MHLGKSHLTDSLLFLSSNNQAHRSIMPSTKTYSCLVVGATGATGKHVVRQLLEKGHRVKVIVRSKERMLSALNGGGTEEQKTTYDDTLLQITEASLLDLTDKEIQDQVSDVDAVISCLGHNLDFKGLFGHPRKLVTEATQRLTAALQSSSTSSEKKQKFLLMNSDGVAHPAGTDNLRPWSERAIISIIRYLIPPHSDNEGAAEHLYKLGKDTSVEWTAVRPTDLIDGESTDYEVFDKPQGSLFGSGTARRSNVAKFMVDLVTDETKWTTYKFDFPVVYDKAEEAAPEK